MAVGAATLAVLLAWPLAYLLWTSGSKLSKTLAALGSMPFALPPIVFGVGLGFFWAFLGGLGHLWAGIVSHAALFLALPLVTISIGLQSIDRAHLDGVAGRDGPVRRHVIEGPPIDQQPPPAALLRPLAEYEAIAGGSF